MPLDVGCDTVQVCGLYLPVLSHGSFIAGTLIAPRLPPGTCSVLQCCSSTVRGVDLLRQTLLQLNSDKSAAWLGGMNVEAEVDLYGAAHSPSCYRPIVTANCELLE